MNFKSNPLTRELGGLGKDALRRYLELAKGAVIYHKGILPDKFGFEPVRRSKYWGPENVSTALVARWDGQRIGVRKLEMLEELAVELSLPETVRTRRDEFGKSRGVVKYRTTSNGEIETTRAYLFTADSYKNLGLQVGRQFRTNSQASEKVRQRDGGWLSDGRTFVELRVGKFETNFNALEYVTRVSTILSGNPPKDVPKFTTDIYKRLLLNSIDPKNQDDLAGLNETIESIRWTLFPSTLPASVHYGLIDRSILLAGVYGIGKTSIAKVLAREGDGTLFVPIDANTLLESLEDKEEGDKTILESVRDLRARTGITPVLWCDDLEIATMDPRKEGLPMDYQAGASTLLNRLQGLTGSDTLLNGASNEPQVIDPRFMQFGRLSYLIHIPLPNEINRQKTLEIHTKNKPIKDVRLSMVAKQTEGFPNRAIEEIVNVAGQRALMRAAESIRREKESLYNAAKRVTQEMAQNFPMTHEDFVIAYAGIKPRIRLNDVVKLDREIAAFCEHNNSSIGFNR